MAALALLAIAQVQVPPRDRPSPQPAPAGTAVIRGRVIAADNRVPIRRAIVMLINETLARPIRQTIYTDARGRYEFRNLPAGEYLLEATPNQYQGQFVAPPNPPIGPARITVADGQIVDGHDLMLPRAGAIVGRLVDADGDPLSGVYVSAQRVGSARTTYNAIASDEHGRYRIYRLVPGDYTVVAKPVGNTDPVGEGAPAIGYIDTYHPSAASRSESTPVRVRAGEETAAGDLVVIRARMLRISGMVTDSRGSPATPRTTVILSSEGASYGINLFPTGRFTFGPQRAGKYRVIARLAENFTAPAIEYGMVTLNLVDTDVEDLVVTMKAAATVSGRVVFEGGTAPTLPRDTLTVRATERSPERTPDFRPPLGRVGADLSFTLRGLVDELLIRTFDQIPGWNLKNVLLGDRDITDVPTEFRDGDVLQVVLTSRASQVRGTVTDDKGQPAGGAQVLLFAEDKAYWFPAATRFGLLDVGPTGSFRFDGLPGGRYYVIALPRERAVDEQSIDPSTLEALIAEATALFIGDDERRQVDLKLSTPNKR